MKKTDVSIDGMFADQIKLDDVGRRWTTIAVVVGMLGWIATGVLTAMAEHSAERFFRSYLVNFTFFLSLALGALFFVLITHLTRAGWSVVLRRIAEAVSLTLPALAVLAVVIVLGRHELYEWTHAEAVASDELLQHKQGYLNTPFFVIRLVGYFVVWTLLAGYFARLSRRQDESGDPGLTLKMERMSSVGTILFAATLTFASFDLIMSLYPHWYSTIFGVYYFSGCALAFFSLVSLLAILLQRARKLTDAVTDEHYHDLGKLMFAFVVFWAYIAFSQYMLIWYAHIPEETGWFLIRQEGPWAAASLALLAGHFFVPFLWLINRFTKRRRPLLALAAVWLLAVHWFDLYWLIMPEASPQALGFHGLDLALLLALGGTLFAIVFRVLTRARLLPVRDPRLEESLRLENV